MTNIQFGAGSLGLPGWENHDTDVDITRPLPYADNSVDFIFTEHLLEHVTMRQAWSFLEECHRILKPGGVARMTVPDFFMLWPDMNPEWMRVNTSVCGCPPTREGNAKSILFMDGHQALWHQELLDRVMQVIGFKTVKCELYQSTHEALRNIEQHWRSVGKEVAMAEASSVEGTK